MVLGEKADMRSIETKKRVLRSLCGPQIKTTGNNVRKMHAWESEALRKHSMLVSIERD